MEIIKRCYIQLEMTEFEFATIRDIVREAYYASKDGDRVDILPQIIDQIRKSLDTASGTED